MRVPARGDQRPAAAPPRNAAWPPMQTAPEPGSGAVWTLRIRVGSGRFGFLARIAQHIAAAPDRLDVVLAAAGAGKLLAQLADEHVDDLQFRFVHPAIEMVEEHFLGQRGAL